MKAILIPTVISFTLAMLTMTGCGSGGDSSNSAASSPAATNLGGGYTITYTEPPLLPKMVAAGLPGALIGLPSAAWSVDDSADRTVKFNLLLQKNSAGTYTGSYSDDSGIISDSVSGSNSELTINFSNSKSQLDDRLSRNGSIKLQNPSLNDKKEMKAKVVVSFDDFVGDTKSRNRNSSGDIESCSRNSDDDSSSSSSSSSSSDSSSSSSSLSSSDDEARIPGVWQAISKDTYPNSGEQLTLRSDKKVSVGGIVIVDSSWTFTKGEPEKLDIVIPGSRTYRMTDVKQRGTIATGTIIEGEAKTSHRVVLRKL